jgi:predicted Zn-dependent protease with MMP-like domain
MSQAGTRPLAHLPPRLFGPGPPVRIGYLARVFAVSNEHFDRLIAEALESIPDDLASAMENVAIFVEDEAEGRNLLGLFVGVPLTRRTPGSYFGVMPDRITLYKNAISRASNSEEDVREQVRTTVIHEIAHHFGISDERLKELGW